MTEVKRLAQKRSDVRGLLHWFGHIAVIAAAAWIYGRSLSHGQSWWIGGPTFVLLGFALVSMFATMHETIHRTAFRSRWLNDTVAWLAGLLSFYNSDFYRHYHGWHHRFTQIPGKDPELENGRPASLRGYLWEMSGIPWWIGKLRTHARLALGRTAGYPYLAGGVRRAVVRSVRLQLGTYLAAIAAAVISGRPWFVVYWLAPVAAAQPILRGLLMAEHTLCSEDDDASTNTRTTYTNAVVRFLMWNMPYHAEHHLHPALPFHTLAEAHRHVAPTLAHVERRGYLAAHVGFIRHHLARRSSGSAA